MGLSVFPAPTATSSSVPNWTLVSRSTTASVTYSFTGLSGYKNYKLVWSGFRTTSGGEQLSIRLNGVTTGAYGGSWGFLTGSGAGGPAGVTVMNETMYPISSVSKTMSSAQDQGAGYCIIEGADSTTGGKTFYSEWAGQSSGYAYFVTGTGAANITSAITSITFGSINGAGTLNPAYVELWGAN